MYETFFGFSRRPFSATPDPDCFVPLPTMHEALSRLLAFAEAGQEIAVVTAPAGIGKTILCRRLVAELKEDFATVFLANANFPTRRSLLQGILYELGHPYVNMGEQELRLELNTALKQVWTTKQATVVVVDEAHLLGDRLLEEVRAITNLVEGGVPLARVILSGQPSLEEKLTDASMQALNQRIGCQVVIEPLTQQESSEYIAERIKSFGADIANIFTPEAVRNICHAADGVPRCLNQLCDHTLLLGFAVEEKPVGGPLVLEALEDLKQLPLHWNDSIPVGDPLDQLRQEVEDVRVESDTSDAVIDESPTNEVESIIEPVIETFEFESVEFGSELSFDDEEDLSQLAPMEVIEVGGPESDDEEPAAQPEDVDADVHADVDAEIDSPVVVPLIERIDSLVGQISEMASTAQEGSPAVPDGQAAVETATDVSAPRESVEYSGFIEEPVVDRYAMIDSGMSLAVPPPVVPSIPIEQPVQSSFSTTETEPLADPLDRPMPDVAVEQILPMLNDAFDTVEAVETEPAATDDLSQQLEELGVVIDTALLFAEPIEFDSIRPSVSEPVPSTDSTTELDFESRLIEPPMTSLEFDIVEPEPDHPVDERIEIGTLPVAETPAEAKGPHYKRRGLFSELRRRQQQQ